MERKGEKNMKIEKLPILVTTPYSNTYLKEQVVRYEEDTIPLLEDVSHYFNMYVDTGKNEDNDINSIDDKGRKLQLCEFIKENNIQMFIELIVEDGYDKIVVDTNAGEFIGKESLSDVFIKLLDIPDIELEKNRIDKPYFSCKYIHKTQKIDTMRITVGKYFLQEKGTKYVAHRLYQVIKSLDFKIG